MFALLDPPVANNLAISESMSRMRRMLVTTTIIHLVLSMFTTGPADGLRSTAPQYLLTLESAQEHFVAASVAAIAFNVDRDILLSIAAHESNYAHGSKSISNEEGGKISCGVMTPVPTYDRKACHAMAASPLAGYIAGARHLREWFEACRGHQVCAFTGYAGGWRAIRACANGPVWIRPGVDGCKTHEVFRWRAGLIRTAIARATAAQRAAS